MYARSITPLAMPSQKIVAIVTSFRFYLLTSLIFVSVHTSAVLGELVGEATTRSTIRISGEEGNDSMDCLNGSIACKSLEYIASSGVNNLNIVFSVGIHVISPITSGANRVTFSDSFNVTIMGSGDPWSSESTNKTILKCYDYTYDNFLNGLAFINPYNVIIMNMTIEGCGMISSGLFARNATLFYIENLMFTNNTGHAIHLENPMDVSITNSLFFNNSGQIYDDTPINDEYGFKVNQSIGGIGIIYTKVVHPVLTIENCTFDSNQALKSPLNDNDTRPNNYKPFGTGGGIFIRFANASYGQLEIMDCKFINNTALVRGGGLYLAFWGHSKHNVIHIEKSLFKDNYCNDSGGAVSLNSFSSSHGNHITIIDSIFIGNEAINSCGAMVYRFSNEFILSKEGRSFSNTIMLKRCMFAKNRAGSVSAVGLYMFGRVDRRTLPVLMEDVTFQSNIAVYTNCTIKAKHISRSGQESITSALFAKMPIEFKGNTTFIDNIGGGITIVERRIDVHGNIEFENNCSPYDGGGISLEDESFIRLFSGSHAVFKNNSAKNGGGISTYTPVIYKDVDVSSFYNMLCFIQYDILITDGLPPRDWNVSVNFENNKAFIGGAALYVNDVSPCTHVPSLESQTSGDTAVPSFNHSLLVLPQFTYRDNSVIEPPDMSNDPKFSSVTSTLSVTLQLQSHHVAPCEIVGCGVQGRDQNQNVQHTVFQINAGDQACSTKSKRIFFVANEGTALVTLHGKDLTGHCDDSFSSNRQTKLNHTLVYSILDPYTGDPFPEQTIEVGVTCCHTGYVFDKKEKKCVFDDSKTIFVAPNENNKYVYIKTGIFAQHMQENNQLIAGILPTSYHKCTIQSDSTTIQGCLFKYDHPYEQCSDNRIGFMCGKCPQNEGLTLNLSDCQQCKASDVVLFFLLCIFIIVTSILIMTFDIGLSNRLRGFLFFAQVVNIVYQRDSGEGTTPDYHLARQFGRSLYLPICLSNEMDALSVVLLGLIVPLMMFLTVLLFIFLAKHIRYLSQHQSVNGIWLIIFLMYVYTARSCFDLLRCVPTYDIDDNFTGDRYYYDGSIKCYDGVHLFYAVISYLLISTIIIPGPFIVVLISYRHFKRTAPFKDVATKGIKQKFWWWSSYDLLRRLAFMIIIILEGYLHDYQQFLLTIISIVCLIITARFHPYQNYWNNLIETLILADLMLLTAYYLPDSSQSVASDDTFEIMLLVAPFVFCVFYISITISKRLWFKFCHKLPTIDASSKEIAFATHASTDSDEKSIIRADDNSRYHQFRDELLVIDSIIQ